MRSALSILAMSLASFAFACSGTTGEVEPSPSEQAQAELNKNSDASVLAKLEAAVVGLEGGGGEADPNPLQVVRFRLSSREQITDALVLDRVYPKIGELVG